MQQEFFQKTLKQTNSEIFDSIQKEKQRQLQHIELIASENFTSQAVLDAQGSIMTNKYAEGYPDSVLSSVFRKFYIFKNEREYFWKIESKLGFGGGVGWQRGQRKRGRQNKLHLPKISSERKKNDEILMKF